MAGKDFYFSSGIIRGVGRLFFLRVPQVAGDGSAPARLLGSIVREGDGGLFGNSEYPVPENSFILGAVLDAMKKVLQLGDADAVNDIDLAGFSQSLKIEKSAAVNGEVAFPGAPLSAGVGVNYKKIRSVELEFGEGARKRLIPRDLLAEAYRRMADRSSDFPAVFFNDDRMVVDQVLLVRALAITVTSESDFSGNFEAKAAGTNDLNVGVKYERKSSRSYTMTLDGSREYLFGVGGVQADKFVR